MPDNNWSMKRASMKWAALSRAARYDEVENARRLLRADRALIGGSNALRQTALHYAAMRGRLAVAKLLLQEGAAVDAADVYGATPLYALAWNWRMDFNKGNQVGLLRTAQLLVDHGADLNARNKDGSTPRSLRPQLLSEMKLAASHERECLAERQRHAAALLATNAEHNAAMAHAGEVIETVMTAHACETAALERTIEGLRRDVASLQDARAGTVEGSPADSHASSFDDVSDADDVRQVPTAASPE
jgi:hypothetical protein